MTEILSGSLAQALNAKLIQEQFDIVRPDINGILALASFGAPVQPEAGDKIAWLNMSVGADALTTVGSTSSGATTINVTDGSFARTGMLLRYVGEYIVVVSVLANAVTVLRGQGGSTAATIPAASALSIESVAREENSQAVTDGIYQPEEVENLFQTMDTGIEMSRRALATLQFGNTNDLSFQVNEKMRQLAIQMDKTLLRGRKMSLTLAGKKTTFTGGLGYFLDQAGALSTNHGNSALTLASINVLQAEIVKRGGRVNSLILGVDLARKLQILVNAEYSSQRLGDFIADTGGLITLPSDLPQIGGVTTIVIDTNMPDNELLLADSSRLTIVPMASGNAENDGAWRTVDATTPGQDGQKVRVIGDFAMEVRDSNTHFARLTNIA